MAYTQSQRPKPSPVLQSQKKSVLLPIPHYLTQVTCVAHFLPAFTVILLLEVDVAPV